MEIKNCLILYFTKTEILEKKFNSCLIVLSILFCNVIFGQDFNWGKISDEEVAMTEVSFEPRANAVKLQEIGDLIITDDGYELNKYERIKILSIEGFENAQKTWSYNWDDSFDRVTVEDAQTINMIDGKTVLTKLDKKDIIISRYNNIEEIAFAFPNVRVGSIIEYKVKLMRPQNLYSSPWRFQHEIPTISSKLNLKLATFSNYKIILKGKILNNKYRGKNIKNWQLNNIPSDKIYKNVYNTEDYLERIMVQYSSARKFYGSYYSENSWKGFKKLILKDIENSMKHVDLELIANQIKNGPTKLETLQNCVYYLRDHYKWNGFLAVNTNNLQNDFLQKKIGNAADFNILLKKILITKNIHSELAINSMRSNGRIIIAYPAFAKLQTLVNIVKIDDGEKIMIDAATSDPASIKYLSLEYFNHIVLGLEESGEVFTTVSPSLSEFTSLQNLKIEGENSVVEIKNRSKGYFNSDSFNSAIFNIFPGVKTVEKKLKEANEWKLSSQNIEFNTPLNSLFVIENPFSQILQKLTVENDRNYPIELNFPYLATIELHTKLPENYQLETDHFNQKIAGFDGDLQYLQEEKILNNEHVITWSLLLNKSIFQNQEIPEYRTFISQLQKIFADGPVIRKR